MKKLIYIILTLFVLSGVSNATPMFDLQIRGTPTSPIIEIEESVTDSDTKLATSGAVVDYVTSIWGAGVYSCTKTYSDFVTEGAVEVVTVTHALGTWFPDPIVWDVTPTGKVIFPDEFKVIDSNSIRLEFATNPSSIRVGVISGGGTPNEDKYLTFTGDSGSTSASDPIDSIAVVGGEGIDTAVTADTITITGENASDTNKGIASFSSDDFSVTDGAVTIKSGGVSNTQLENSSVSLGADSGSGSVSLGETYVVVGGEGIDTSVTGVTLTVAGEEASTSNKGVASFTADDFDVSSGVVSIEDTTVRSISTDGDPVTPSGHSFTIEGGSNITTSGSGSTATVTLDASIDLTAMEADTVTQNSDQVIDTISIASGSPARGSEAGGTYTLTVTPTYGVNLLKNTGWNVASTADVSKDYGSQFTAASMASISNGVVACTETNSLTAGSLIYFTGSAPIGGNYYKVTAVVNDTSFTLHDTSITMGTVTQTAYQKTPGWEGGTGIAPDGWYKDSSLDLYREPNGTNTKEGEYFALKSSPTNQDDYLYYAYDLRIKWEYVSKFAGRTVTFGSWIKSSTAEDICLGIYYYDGSHHYEDSSSHTGGGAYEWLEKTVALPSDIIYFAVRFQHQNASPGVAYISQPMLVYGSHIGEGNYCRSADKVIWLDDEVQLSDFWGDSYDAGNNLDSFGLEAQTEGKISGASAVYLSFSGKCTTPAKTLAFGNTSYPINVGLYSQVNGVLNRACGWLRLNDDDTFLIYINDAFTDIYMPIVGAHLR